MDPATVRQVGYLRSKSILHVIYPAVRVKGRRGCIRLARFSATLTPVRTSRRQPSVIRELPPTLSLAAPAARRPGALLNTQGPSPSGPICRENADPRPRLSVNLSPFGTIIHLTVARQAPTATTTALVSPDSGWWGQGRRFINVARQQDTSLEKTTMEQLMNLYIVLVSRQLRNTLVDTHDKGGSVGMFKLPSKKQNKQKLRGGKPPEPPPNPL